MAKNKRNIDDFQKAMLANTKVIKNSAETKVEELKNTKKDENIVLPAVTKSKLEKFAKKHNLSLNEVVVLAVEHFLDLEDYWFAK